MTVRRRATIDFNAERPAVAAVVKSVLACNPPYRWSREVDPERVFTTNVKPSWWLLGTKMTVELEAAHCPTTMNVQTKSQWFILGDVFGYYNHYIREFESAVREGLERAKKPL
jgi:hypothetical protein